MKRIFFFVCLQIFMRGQAMDFSNLPGPYDWGRDLEEKISDQERGRKGFERAKWAHRNMLALIEDLAYRVTSPTDREKNCKNFSGTAMSL
jgi:hypothetical protein